MSETESTFVKRHWKLLLNIITIAALLGLVIAIRHQLAETLKNLKHVNVWVLLLIIPIELLNYHAQARMYQRIFKVIGKAVPYRYLYRLSVEINFINHIFPSGGVSGISYFGLQLRDKKNIRVATSTLAHTVKLLLLFLSFEVFVIFGMFSLAVRGHSNNLVILIGSSVTTLLIVGTAGFFYLVGSKQRIDAFFTGLTHLLNRLLDLVRRGHHPETINVAVARKAFTEFHDDYGTLKSHWRELQAPFFYALLANATEVAAIYVVYIAFGEFVNIGAVILAYAIANFAGLISVLPGGVGVYEALMTAVLSTAGVPAAVSIPVTVMYRVVSILVQVPPGFVLYHDSIKHGGPKAEAFHGS